MLTEQSWHSCHTTGADSPVLGCNVTRGRLSYRAASSDILNVNQWHASVSTEKGRTGRVGLRRSSRAGCSELKASVRSEIKVSWVLRGR